MKKSITKRYFFIFMALLFFVTALLFVLTTLLTDPFIQSYNRQFIDQVFDDHYQQLTSKRIDHDRILSLGNQYDLGIVIVENGNMLNCTSFYLCSDDTTTLPTYVTRYFPLIPEGKHKSYTLDYQLIDVEQMVTIYNVGNGRFIIFNQALDSVLQIKQILQLFIWITSLTLLTLGFIVFFFVSRKVTKPILSISHYAKDISQLNFSRRLPVDREDEIGQLQQHMNLIAERLDNALDHLQKSNHALKEELDREKELEKKQLTFFASASHELKTPITIIQGYAEGLKRKIVSSHKQIDYYHEVIFDEAQHMATLVSDLLEVTKIKSEQSLNIETFNLSSFIQTFIDRFSQAMAVKKLHLYFESTDCIIHADRFKVEQVFKNLLSNAIKFAPIDGVIRITIKKDSDRIKLYIFNNGPQIPKDKLNLIWDVFFKDETEQNQNGSGIGLAIVKSIMELHHGSYGVHNLSDGVEFYVTFPQTNKLINRKNE